MADQLSGSSGAAVIAFRLHRVPDELQARMRPVLRQVGQRAAGQARTNASWSSRIPRSIGVRVAFAGKRAGVTIVARRAIAPHARAYEGISARGDTFRHPVFGERDVWVAQRVRPFLAPAVSDNAQTLAAEAQGALEAALTAAGFQSGT